MGKPPVRLGTARPRGAGSAMCVGRLTRVESTASGTGLRPLCASGLHDDIRLLMLRDGCLMRLAYYTVLCSGVPLP